MILDSGDRTEFDTGAVRDFGSKGDMSLVPWLAVMRLSKHCQDGAEKYGKNNVRKGIPQSSFVSSAMRHLAKYAEGMRDEDHLVASFWNIGWALEQEEQGRDELMDLFWQMNEKAMDDKLKQDAEHEARVNEVMEKTFSKVDNLDQLLGCDVVDLQTAMKELLEAYEEQKAKLELVEKELNEKTKRLYEIENEMFTGV